MLRMFELLLEWLTSLVKSRRRLEAENLALRHQLNIAGGHRDARHRDRRIDGRQYMVKRPRRPGQSWMTFLRNHAQGITAADLFVVPTIGFTSLYCLVFVAHGRWKLIHCAVTAHPTAESIARQIVEAFPWDEAPRYPVRDRDAVYREVVRRRLRG